jgi:hypothetical protein
VLPNELRKIPVMQCPKSRFGQAPNGGRILDEPFISVVQGCDFSSDANRNIINIDSGIAIIEEPERRRPARSIFVSRPPARTNVYCGTAGTRRMEWLTTG